MVIINQTIINNFAAKINAKEKTSNKTTTISSSSTDTQYPSAKAVYTALQNAGSGATVDIDYYFDTTGKELVFEYDNISGINEGNSLSVNIATSWGSPTSDEKVPSEALVKSALDGKAASDHTHSQYLTEHQSLSNYVQKSNTTGLLKNDGTVDTNSYSTTSHTHGQVTSDGKVTSTAVTVASGDNILITDYSDSSKIKRVANILAGHVKDSTAHSNIGSSANDTQATINSDIDTALSGKQATLVSGTNIKTVNNESLLGSGNITIQGGSSVDVVTSWEATLSDSKVPSEKLVKNTIDGLSIPTKTSDLTNDGDGTNVFVKNNDSRLTDSRTPTSHTHGNLTNDGKVGSNANYIVVTGTGGAITSVQKLGNITYDGKIGSTSGKPIITTTSGTLTTGSFGSTSGTFAEGNHTHSGYISTSSTTGLVKNDGSIMTSGTGSTNYAAGNHTHSGYISTSSTTGLIKNDGTVMTSGTGSTNYAAGNHTHSGYVSTSDIADNLTTNDSSKVLSAKQGYQLNQLIGQAIAYINQ